MLPVARTFEIFSLVREDALVKPIAFLTRYFKIYILNMWMKMTF